ncbi:hypothetical protein [Marinomonas sp. TW1]|uniref:hypothetical protein n=1 Tax=Marinomonas sp. TW1 TaxID=1561203 RepID=UPI0007AFDEB8|nr:hypothetical protein [Marinomonas sp. TW1]KZN14516.1 hypothetical protein OA79_04330 [Marinomonas sp. TW1]
MDAQDGNYYSQSDNEAYANNFGSNLADYTNLALDINGYDSGMAITNSHVSNTSHYVETNTAHYKGLDKEQGDNWNLMHVNMNPWHAPEAVDRVWVQPVKNFPKDLKVSVHGIDDKDLLEVGNRAVTIGTMVAPQRVGWSI